MVLVADKRIEVNDTSRRTTYGNPQEDKSRPSTKNRKDVTCAVELAVKEFAKEVWAAEKFTFVETLLELIGNPNKFYNLINLPQFFQAIVRQGFFLKRTLLGNMGP